MATILRTRRAIDAGQATTPTAFAAVRTIAPNIADRLDEAAIEKAAAEGELAYVNDRLRRLHPPAVFREHVSGQRRIDFELDLDDVDRRVAIANLEGQRVEVSRRVKAARDTFDTIKLEAENVLLHRASADWTARETALVAQRHNVEQTCAQFVAALIAYGEACAAETAAARASTAVAHQAVRSDEARQALRIAARTGEVPVAIGDDGFADTIDRPELGLFGDDHIDFGALGRTFELAYTDPARAAKNLAGTALGKTIETR